MFLVDRDYSQYGEQEIIIKYFENTQRPYKKYCVDAGAFDGVVGSNSRILFLNGWTGLLIEPNPRTFQRLASLYRERTDISCIQVALSDSAKSGVPMEFSVGPPGVTEDDKWMYAQVSTLHKEFAESYKHGYGYIYESAEVDTETLEHVLLSVNAPVHFGFLSVDCEGEDIKIIRAFDFKKYAPLLVCVESDDNNRPFFAEVLEMEGYQYLAHTVSNTFYERKQP